MNPSMNRLVLCHGCFDILHIGHLLHFMAASELGRVLVVSITKDEHIRKPGAPTFNESQRASMVRALRCVNEVYICQSETAVDALMNYKPDIFAKGPDYNIGNLNKQERDCCNDLGIDIVFTNTPKYSSSELRMKL